MDFPPPYCYNDQLSSCTEGDWVQCTECARLICTVHDEIARVRHAGRYAGDKSAVCAPCVQVLYERGEVARNRSGYQYINRR